MSGSTRAITLRLSVQDADTVRQELLQMGQAGENALQRLDAAAQRATGGAGGTSGGVGGFRYAVGQAGYQIQDFAVQVQGGTSALTALSQQGSQFLGIFGPAGAFAGAALTVGILAVKFLDIPPAIESATEATNRHADAMAASNELYENAIDKANRLARARLGAATAGLEERLTAERAALRDVNDQARGVTRSNLADEAERAATGGGAAPEQSAAVAARLREEALARAQQAQEISDRIAALDVEMARIAAIPVDGQQFGPNAPGGGGGGAVASAEALRRQLDDRYRIQRDYQIRVDQLQDMARTGVMETAEAARLEGEATRQRDEALERLTRAPGGHAAGRAERPGIDVQGVLAAGVRESTSAFDAFNAALNLNEAGLSGAQGALDRYARDMQMLDTALTRGAITEDQFTAAVEASTLALGTQIEEVERRGQRVGNLGRDLGMTFSSAFEDAILKGGKFSDILKAIEQDIARIILRQAVTAPLTNAISGAVGNFNFSSLLSSGGSASGGASAGGFLFADGGIMSGRGPVPLRRYAGGGIANSPQLAMFGEGAQPEAYVPLPDGRAIPVKMEGGGGAINYTQNITVDARGSDAATLARARIEAQAIAQANIAQFAESIRNGGAGARLVGRR